MFLYKNEQKQETKTFFNVISEVVASMKVKNPLFSVGLIVLGNKKSDLKEQSLLLEEILDINNPLVVGIDFEQEGPEDDFPSLSRYNDLIDELLLKHPES